MVETVSDATVKKVRSTLRFAYDPPDGLTWEQEKGEMKWLTGSWVLEELDGGGTRATYALRADPGRMLGLLLRGPVEGKVKEMLTKSAAEGLKEKAEKLVPSGRLREHVFVHRETSWSSVTAAGELKRAEDFAWRRKSKGQRDSFCRPCRSAYGKEHYQANKQRYIDQARDREAATGSTRTNPLPDRLLRETPMRGLRRSATQSCWSSTTCGTSRSTSAQALPWLQVADDPRRDREMRGRLRQLPSTPHRAPPRCRFGPC